MDKFDFDLEHLIFVDRTCKSCGEVKNLINDFYMTRKDRGSHRSSYSYECKSCTKKRISKSRKNKYTTYRWEYPDW